MNSDREPGQGGGRAVLLADVGGTNTRLAVSRGGAVGPATRLANDEYRDFADLLAGFRAGRALPPLAGCCIAVAGPVHGGRARLTNRDWRFAPQDIAAALGLPGPAAVRLVNDLAALGHALPALGPAQLSEIRPGQGGGNGQALVAGLGTGFNICAVTTGAGRAAVFAAELGHASLPECVAAALRAAIGPAAAGFGSVEALFSGPGLSRLYSAVSGGASLGAAELLAAYAPARRDAVAEAVELAASLLGRFARELALAYLPLDGLYFAGGAARGLLGAAAGPFLAALADPGAFAGLVARMPVRLIIDDAAALTGLARLAAPDQ